MTTRAISRRSASFDELAADIVKASKTSRVASAASVDEVRLLDQQDYGRPLRRMFSRSEVRQIISEARKTVWPNLNDDSVKLVSPDEFTRRWKGLGVRFQLAKLNGEEGTALLGFYVRKIGSSKLPLICVNTAHHPAAIGAAFSHEMGHHVTGRLFDSRRDHAQLLVYTAYGEHLEDPEELAADMMVSLGVFPENIARKLFSNSRAGKSPENADAQLSDSVFATVLKYMEVSYGLNFGGSLPSTKKLQYLAALIHFAKLRRALLTEYDI